ncbi:molecular chaperone [Yersinia pestis]|nr:molecular chaperone [Yersinia pestis]MRO36277.1 molecular chaperone [Yersinia pestis]MRQ14389.1 molecular chaperone [Yersinia pestis]
MRAITPMLLNTTLPRILGACFYYPPQSDTVQRLFPLLPHIAELFPWPDHASMVQYCQQIPDISPERLEYDFSILFEGQGVMPAPPWGSVYLDKENILMGASTLQYREFLAEQGWVSQSPLREPEDQFGLMLLAWVNLIEQHNKDAASVLLTAHLLPWAYRYLEQVNAAQVEYPVYPLLAKIAACYLKTLQTELVLSPLPRELYR